MPMSEAYRNRLLPNLETIAGHFGTPFHIYDEIGIRQTGEALKKAFAGVDHFKEFYAVKALPNPRILELMLEMGFGFDCSSVAELVLARRAGGKPEDIMFTSNNTSAADFRSALSDNGCLLNLDDISLLPKVPAVPEMICFRYNPGPRRTGNSIIGNPKEAKYGVAHHQIVDAYRQARSLGATKFGIHTMLASNELNYTYMVQTTQMLFELVEWISSELDITFDFINIGGGLGIAYRPEDAPFDIGALGKDVSRAVPCLRRPPGVYAQTLHGKRPPDDRPSRRTGHKGHQPQGNLSHLRGRGCLYVIPDAPGNVRRLSPHRYSRKNRSRADRNGGCDRILV